MIIALDYDGTITHDDAWPAPGVLKPGAKEVINRLYDEGHSIIIWTCRCGEALQVARSYLEAEGIKFHHCNEHLPHVLELYGNDTRKILADVYIDDKNLGGLPDTWEEIYQLLKQKHLCHL